MARRLQITVSERTYELIERSVKEIKDELGECAVVRTGYALGVVLEKYYKDKEKNNQNKKE